MSPEGSIEVAHLWKRFRADRARQLLRDRISEMSLRRKNAERWRWVLRDIDLRAEPGEAIGLVGANGSGKSTLLKILTQVMYPYAGRAEVRGRVGALLEVRAGLHPDLSGRENVYLYGTLLGIERSNITKRFDDIVDFANLADAIDRQVKFYSSGMQMRLGFAVAAFLEPHVLLVDEALAVGDAFFQQRCLDRMSDLIRQGTTLVLVSHDLPSVESVCSRAVWLDAGEVRSDGPIREVLAEYRGFVEHAYHDWLVAEAGAELGGRGDLQVVKATITHDDGGPVRSQEPAIIELVLEAPRQGGGTVCLGVSEGTATPVFITTQEVDLAAGKNTIRCRLPFVPLAAGRYYLWAEQTPVGAGAGLDWQPVAAFVIEGRPPTPAPLGILRVAPVQVDADWLQDDE